MLNTSKFAALTLFSALAINSAFAEDEAKTAVMVNGIAVPQARIDFRVKAAITQGQIDTPELRKAIRGKKMRFERLQGIAGHIIDNLIGYYKSTSGGRPPRSGERMPIRVAGKERTVTFHGEDSVNVDGTDYRR